jgi:two-component system response regulator GlrR
MREMLERAQLFASANVPVLIEGASGTGKSFVAQCIHLASPRAHMAFRWVNTAAMEDSLAGSELFGHARGAFTGASHQRAGYLASANGGTVFLDEIGKASRVVQAKLLHVIEHREFCALGEDRPRVVDVRFLAAASEGLDHLVTAGTFLADLRERLRGFRVVVPSLCDRREDIPDLVDQFAWAHATRAGYEHGPPSFDADVARALSRAPWPGNLRELSTAVHLLLVYARGAPAVTLSHCRGDLAYLGDLTRARHKPNPAEVAEALRRSSGNKSAAARLIGVSRSTLHRKLRRRPPPFDRGG